MKRIILFALLLVLASFTVHSQAAIGTVDGYIWNFTPGSPLAGASVQVTVGGSCVTNCYATYTSESTGYYVVTNLDFAPGRPITVEADLGNFYGTNSGSSVDSFTPQQINVSACEAPSNPTLSPIANSHSNALFSLSWTSGIDPNSNPTYDKLTFDAVVTNNSFSPVNKTNLAYGAGGTNRTYAWSVKTCNSQCCSSGSQDSFVLINNLPTLPTLTSIPDSTNSAVEYEWTTSTDSDGDNITYDLYLDGVITNDVTSPIPDSVGTGAHTWGIRACDSTGCSNFVYDSFTITNNAPNAPNLTDEINSADLSRTFEWTSTTPDIDGDPVHSQFQLSIDSGFSTLVVDNTNTSSPYSYSVASDTIYYWRVRNCDNKGACSAYVSDLFFTFTCPTCTGGGSSSGGGGGGGSSCIEQWVCQDWGSCDNGFQTRGCTDNRNCARVKKPSEVQSCNIKDINFDKDDSYADGEQVGSSTYSEYFLADFDEINFITQRLGPEEIWHFLIDGSEHTARILGYDGLDVEIMVESNPTQIFKITPGQDIKLELDGDGIPDLLVTYNEKVGTKADLTWKRIELTPVEKIIAQPVYIAKQTLGKWWYVHSLVYAIALLEVLLGIFLYAGFVRGRHVDANLIRYISLGRHQGFKDEHIMEKLLKHGWTKEEISWALKQLKEK